MTTFTTKTSLLALAATALLALGAGAASAQDFTRPNSDIRALEAPIDATVVPASPVYNALVLGTRSVTNGSADNAWTHYEGSTSVPRH